MATLMMSPFKGLRDGMASAFDTLLEKGGSAKQFFQTISTAIGRSMIQAFSQMVADWVVKNVMMAAQWAATQSGMTALFAAHTATRTAVHTAGEVAQTGATAAGSSSRGGIRVLETVFHGVQVGIRTAAHFMGELMMTAISLAQSLVRHAIVFLETQPYIILAGIEAASSVASIPYVGPILAPIAAATTIAALEALAAFAEGTNSAPGGMALIGEKGPELMYVPHGAQIIPNHVLSNMSRAGSGSAAAAYAGGGGASVPASQTHMGIYMDKQKMVDDLSRSSAHEKFIVDVMARNIHKFA